MINIDKIKQAIQGMNMDFKQTIKRGVSTAVQSLPPVQAYNAVRQVAPKVQSYFNPTSNQGQNFWSSPVGTGASKLQQNIMGVGQKLQQFPDTTIRYRAPQPFATPTQKLFEPVRYEAQKFLTGLPGEIVRDLGRTYETIASPNAKDIYKQSIARVKQNPFQLKTLEEPIVRDVLNLTTGPADIGDLGRFAVGALPVAGLVGSLKLTARDARAIKPFLPEIRNVSKMLGNMGNIPNLTLQQVKATEEIVAKIKGPEFVKIINQNARNAGEYYDTIRRTLAYAEDLINNPQAAVGLSTKALDTSKFRQATKGVESKYNASKIKNILSKYGNKLDQKQSASLNNIVYGLRNFDGDVSDILNPREKSVIDGIYRYLDNSGIDVSTISVNKAIPPVATDSFGKSVETSGTPITESFSDGFRKGSVGGIYDEVVVPKKQTVSDFDSHINTSISQKEAQKAFIDDFNINKNTKFNFKIGDSVVDLSNRKFMVKSSYIDNGVPKYDVYTPGKKNSMAHQFTIRESELQPPATKGVESIKGRVSTTTPKTIKVGGQSMKQPQVALKDTDNVLPQKTIPVSKTTGQGAESTFDSSLPQRGFAKTVMESPKTPDVLKPSLEELRYNPLSNKQTLKFADDLIKKNEVEALNYAKTGTDTNANATASRLIEKYLDAGRFDEADELIREVAPRFTKQGQDIQILATYGRLTPTGAVRYAQNLINKANKSNPRLNLKLTPERTKIITQYAKDIRGLKEGSRAKIVATAKLIQNIKDIIPTSVGQKISSIQTMMQLLNPKTTIRNILGNTIFTGMENVSDVLGAGIDNIVGIITGKRSKVLPSLKAQAGGFVRGAREGFEDVKLGIDTSGGIATQFDFQSKTFTDPIFGNLEKALNIELRVPDRAAYTAAFEGSLNNQMRSAGLKTPTEEMLQVAHADGLYRTFQDNSKLANFFGNVKKTLNILGTPDGKFGVGDFLLKYPRTPANILSRGLDYSPVGFVKGMYEVVRPLLTGQEFNQKAFVEALSRAMAGTGLIVAGYNLADKGIITGKSEKDYDISSIQRTTGQGPFKINVDALKRYWLSGGQKQDAQNGDLLVSYDWAQPTSLQLAMGANSAVGGGNEQAIDSLLNSLQGGVDTLTGQPMVKGLMDFATGVKNKGLVGAGAELAVNSLAGFSPSLLRQFGNLSDTTQRSTYDPNILQEGINRVTATIPFARKTLEPKLDVFGREMPNYEGGTAKRIFDIFFNPSFTSRVKENPAAKEVIDIYQRSGLTTQAPRVAPQTVKINGENVKVSPQQYTEYQRYIGTKTDAIFNQLVSSQSFMAMSDEDKAKTMQNILTDINSAAKIEIFGNNPKTVSARTKQIIGGDIDVAKTTISKSNSKSAKKPKKITLKVSNFKAPTINIKRKSSFKAPTIKIKKPKKIKLVRRKI